MAKEFNLLSGKKAERRLFATFVDVSSDEANEPEWEILGVGVEESALELNPDISTVTDILGITVTDINKLEEKQTFDPNSIRGGQKLNARLLDIARKREISKFAGFKTLRVWDILGVEGKKEAEVDEGCTIIPTSIGGSSYLDMPIEVTFSGNRIFGTVDSLKNPTFTPVLAV